MMSPAITRALLALGIAAASATASAGVAGAATDGPYQDVYHVNGCASSTGGIFSPSSYGNMAPFDNCPSELDIDAPGPGAGDGNSAKWAAITPSPAIRIVGVTSTGVADCNLHHDGFQAGYFYGDNGVNYGVPSITVDCHGAINQNGYAGSLNQHIQSSRYLGWQASCTHSTCTPTGAGIIVFSVLKIMLEAQETSGPALTADASNNLYYQSGWVRGTFPTDLSASDPSGVCSMQTTVNGRALSSYTDPSPDTSQWTQCAGSAIDASVNTTAYPNRAGAIALGYSASNAAGAVSSVSRAINVDNITPSVSLAAPGDTVSTAGTRNVTASGSAGPSGVAASYCSVDGGPVQTYRGASAQIPVSGIGSHQVTCYDRNRAVDSSGATAISPTQTLDLSIRQPTAAAITFARIADALRCHPTIETVTVAGRLHRVRRHGKTVLVRGRPRTLRRRVRVCHARTVLRTVSVVLKRHGRPVLRGGKPVRVKRRERVVVLPHTVEKPTRTIAHGNHTTVSGFVALADGTALAGQSVQVLSAPDDNAPRFTPMATVTTNADGEWTARVPAGPSRLIEAAYHGSATTEPAVSSTVTLSVPARIALSVTPRVLPWAAQLRIRGRLVGGYVPADGVALRLLVRYPGATSRTPLLALRTNSRGRFAFTWSYHAGRGIATYP
ncbi:MAG TPA: carboxypeptidase-like regulatory domain-containing protein, partial [Mycobacterium sp.]|nr:carboxypeptidase-like regulatory domain-containing protein [Mycobacterium sp.]